MPVLVAGGPGFLPGAQIIAGAQLQNQGGVGFSGAKLQTLGAISEEMDGYQESFRDDGTQQVKRVFKVLWGARKLWIDQMMGYCASLVDVAGDPYLSRTIPDQVPEAGYEHLYCSEVSLKQGVGVWANNPNVFAHDAQGNVLNAAGQVVAPPFGPLNAPALAPMIAYFDPATKRDGLAIYEAVYTGRKYEIRTDAELNAITDNQGELERCVEFALKPAIQAIPLTSGSILYTTGPNAGDKIPDNANFLYLHTSALEYTWHEVPDYPDAAIAACVGAANQSTFDGASGRASYPPQTLLCQAPLSVERYRHTTGRVYWRIAYSFLYRPLGWNKLPDSNGDFQSVTRKNGDPLYPEADFNQLFTAPDAVQYQ